jgi:hypothetical protein
MMAISCLMIEALEAFFEGWENTRGKSELAFCRFFAQNDGFDVFRRLSRAFYENVRCGILHQAETTGGWRITSGKKAPLLDSSAVAPAINAERFLENLKMALERYCRGLEGAKWQSEQWRHVQTKLKALCDNRRP